MSARVTAERKFLHSNRYRRHRNLFVNVPNPEGNRRIQLTRKRDSVQTNRIPWVLYATTRKSFFGSAHAIDVITASVLASSGLGLLNSFWKTQGNKSNWSNIRSSTVSLSEWGDVLERDFENRPRYFHIEIVPFSANARCVFVS